MRCTAPVALRAMLAAAMLLASEAWAVEFEVVTIDPEPGKVVYAVTVADVDGDGREDAVALTENQLLWYQAPQWTKRVILSGGTQADNVCVAPHDIDGDGQVDFAVGAGWPKSGGTIQWVARGESLDDRWSVYPIAAEPWTHRMRWADVLGSGHQQLVVSPLNATSGPGVRLTAFAIPANPRTDRWKPTVLDASLDRLHNHWCVPQTAVGLTETADQPTITLTASQEGVRAIIANTETPVETHQVGFLVGATGESPAERGAGEVRTGRLASGQPFLATIEPMHGTHAVVYLINGYPDNHPPTRIVLTDQLKGGHAVGCADLDGDGDDEVVIGYREPNPQVGVLVFDRQADGKWSETAIDPDGVACEDLVIADLTGDGRPDILAGGRATHNVRLYVNRGTGNSRRSVTPQR